MNWKRTGRSFLTTIGMGAIALLASMCAKEKEETVDSNTNTAFVQAYLQNVSIDIDLIGAQAGDMDTNTSLATYKIIQPSASILSTCATIIYQKADSTNADTLTVDFGNNNCICSDGKVRVGKLQYVYTAGKHYKDSAVSITCTPAGYYIEGSFLYGSKTITNRGRNTQGQLNWSTTENLTLVKVNNGGSVTWNAGRDVVILNTDSVYSGPLAPINWLQTRLALSGFANGVADDGRAYSATITERLIRDLSCSPSTAYVHRHPFIRGKITYIPADKDTRTIDYGDGTCDLEGVIKVGVYSTSFIP